MKRNLRYSIIIILTFLFAAFGKRIIELLIIIPFTSTYSKIVYSYLWWIIPTIIVLGLLFNYKNIFKNTGLDKGIIIGFLFAVITVSPMFISSAIIGKIDENLDITSLIHKTIIAGFTEEYFFRGFLFGILFRKLAWGFIPAASIGALIFGLGHFYQGSTLIETTSIFLVTSMGAVWFSWLYIEWDNNLWIPIFLHTFMNLSWILFEVSQNAMGGVYTNIFRIITIALTIIITIYYHKKAGLKITNNNLIFNKNNS
ncbi:MAG: CPBP family intramembrane metalloprotease [Bacteroidetes bacterium]|nr:MAG: CPBP family intramembrane metalloprotease [Bacteroidota bacterium]